MNSHASIREPCCKKKPGLYKGTRLHELGNGQSFCFRNSRASIREPCCKKNLACIREHVCLHELGNGQSFCFYYLIKYQADRFLESFLRVVSPFGCHCCSTNNCFSCTNDKRCKEPNRIIDVHLLIQEKYCLNK